MAVEDQKLHRVIVTYTTIPSRYDSLKQSILTIKNQTYKVDVIYVTIPKISARLKIPYPPIPDDLAELCTIVESDIDFGPITKIYGGLISETDPETCIISCDDDVLFEPTFIEILMNHHDTHPNSAITGTGALIAKGLLGISMVSTLKPFDQNKAFTGFPLDADGRRVDLVFGVGGILYKRDMFPQNDMLIEELFKHSLSDDSIFHNDDVLISGYLCYRKIERRVFYDIPPIQHNSGQDALSGDFFKMVGRMEDSIEKVRRLGYFQQYESVSYDETVAGKIGMGIFFLLLMIIFCICIILYKPNIYRMFNFT